MDRFPGLGPGAELHTRVALLEIALVDACGSAAPALIADLKRIESRAALAAMEVRGANFEGLTE